MISNEIKNLKLLKGEYITNIYDIFHTKTELYIVLDYGPDDLYKFLDDYQNGVPEQIAKKIIKQLLRAVHFCHSKFIYHRDLKPENILINPSDDFHVYLCDFGLSICLDNNESQLLSDFLGSPGFFPPEMITEKKYYGDKYDIWSIGAILLEILLGHDEFEKRWLYVYENNIIKNKKLFEITITNITKTLPKLPKLSEKACDMIVQILRQNPNERITIENLFTHPWLNTLYYEKPLLSSSFPSLESDMRLLKTNKSFIKQNKSELSLPNII